MTRASMGDPVITLERWPITPGVVSHPMATRTGIALLGHLISADVAWSGCTGPQRAVLADLCPPVVEVLLRGGGLGLEQLPLLPAGTRQVMRDALHRRGLVDVHGRLTGKAVHAWYYAVWFKDERAETAVAVVAEQTVIVDTAAGAPNQGGAE